MNDLRFALEAPRPCNRGLIQVWVGIHNRKFLMKCCCPERSRPVLTGSKPPLTRRFSTSLTWWLVGTATVIAAGAGSAAVFNFTGPTGDPSAQFTGSSVSITLTGQNPINVISGSTEDIRIANGIVAWSSATTVYSYVFDRARSQWKGTSSPLTSGPTFDLSNADGVVAWSTSGGAFFRVYDPAAGIWVGGSGAGPISEAQLLNSKGVVAWSTVSVVNYSVYDPTRNGWRNGSATINGSLGTPDLRNTNGIVAWSVSSGVSTVNVFVRVYDPIQGAWMGNVVASQYTTDLEIKGSQVTWSSTAGRFFQGYNRAAGGWVQGPPAPLAFFAVSTNSGNAPFLVSFIDMSIGVSNSWSWNFGDGMGASTQRSPTYSYTTFGRYTATQTVDGSTSTNRIIVTDTIAPTGTNQINNGNPFTTNPIVNLTLKATDNSGLVTDMRFSNTNGLNWSLWEPYATNKTWRLSAGIGVKTVFAQFRDNASNTSLNATATITLDTTPLPVASFISTNVNETAGEVTVTVTLDHPLNRTVSVRYTTADGTATAPGDYTLRSGLLTFAPNTTAASFVVPIVVDELVELNETVLLNFTEATDAVLGPQGTITIIDEGVATVSFASSTFTATESNGTATITVALNAASGKTVTVAYFATNGTASANLDYVPVQGVLTFNPGDTSLTFDVPLIDEELDEFSETIVLGLATAGNATIGSPATATLTILDDDNPIVFFSRSTYPVSEGSGVAVVQVWLSKPFGLEVGVEYTAFGGTATPGFPGDYFAASGRLVFPPTTTNQTFFVNLVNDGDAEPAETVELRLSNVVNASPGTIEAEILIYDDDGPPHLLSSRLNPAREFQTTIIGKAGQKFSIEVSTNLPNWSVLATRTNTTGILEFTDPGAVNFPHRFYRISVP
jgi:PKD repeat protein